MVWTKYYVNYHNFFNFFMYTFIFYEIISSHLVYLFLWRYATYIYTCTIFASQTLILLFNIAYFKKTLGNVLISWHLKNVSCFFFPSSQAFIMVMIYITSIWHIYIFMNMYLTLKKRIFKHTSSICLMFPI